MFVILGPSSVEHGVDPDTAIVGFGDGMGMLGPATGPSSEVDKVARLFLVLGKLIAARRVVTQDKLSEPKPPAAIETFGALQAFALDQTESSDEFDVVWRPLARQIQQNAVRPLTHHTADLDQRTRRFIAAEMHAVLAFDPRSSVEQRMADLDAYLRHNGFTVEAGSDGFRDFIEKSFVDTRGNRINLPTSDNPSFPDSWITPVPVDPQDHGGSRREWSLIW